jgi:hypothetical protein
MGFKQQGTEHRVLVYPVIFLVKTVSPATRFVPVLLDRVTSRSVLDWAVTGAIGRGLDNHNIVRVACHLGMGAGLLAV